MFKVSQSALLWLVSEACQISMSDQVALHLPGQPDSWLCITTQLVGEVGHGVNCFVSYVELGMAPTDAIWLFSNS